MKILPFLRTNVRKLLDVRGHETEVNIALTNPEILQTSIFISTSLPCSEEDWRGQENRGDKSGENISQSNRA